MFRKKDDYYILLLKYAREQIEKGNTVHFKEVYDHVRAAYPSLNEEAIKRTFFDAMERLADFSEGYDGMIKKETPQTLTLGAYFQLLEHQALQEARRSSNRAFIAAMAAIGIAVLSILLK